MTRTAVPAAPAAPASLPVHPAAARAFLQGKALLKARRHAEALAAFKQAIACQGLYPDACRGVAMCCHAQGDATQTVVYLIKATAHLIRLQRLDPAAKLFGSIRIVYPAAPNLFLLAAQAAARARRWDCAADLFAHAAAFSPQDPELVLGHAGALHALGRDDDALAMVESLLFQGQCVEEAEALYQRIAGEPWGALPETADLDLLDVAMTVVGEIEAPPVSSPVSSPVPAPAHSPAPPAPHSLSRSLVVVDDEPHIRMLMEEALEELEDDDVRMLFARDGQEGLDLIRRERPRLVFLDVMMPRMNGYQVCERVKGDPDLRGVCIVMLSAKGQEVDRIKGEAVGADLYMTKPFSPMELLATARRLLGLTRAAA